MQSCLTGHESSAKTPHSGAAVSKQTITSCDVCKRVDKPMRHAFGVDLCSYCEGNDTKVGALMDAFEKAEAERDSRLRAQAMAEAKTRLSGAQMSAFESCGGCTVGSYDEAKHTCPRGQR